MWTAQLSPSPARDSSAHSIPGTQPHTLSSSRPQKISRKRGLGTPLILSPEQIGKGTRAREKGEFYEGTEIYFPKFSTFFSVLSKRKAEQMTIIFQLLNNKVEIFFIPFSAPPARPSAECRSQDTS
jgi:hypothetical protein